MNGDLADLNGAEEVASYLRARGAVVVCGFGTVTVEDAAETAIQEEILSEPPVPAAEQNDEPVEGPEMAPEPTEQELITSMAPATATQRRPPARRTPAFRKPGEQQTPRGIT